jgi:hypothetical protein
MQLPSTRWLANPNLGHRHFPRNFRSLYAYLIYYRSEDVRAW